MAPALPSEIDLLRYRVIEVPDLRFGDDKPDPAELRGRMLPPLAVAAAASVPVAAAWLRRRPHQKVEVLVGGVPDIEGTVHPDDRVNVSFPLGAVARRLAPTAAASALSALPHWLRCEARSDVLAVAAAPPAGRLLDDYFALLAHQPL